MENLAHFVDKVGKTWVELIIRAYLLERITQIANTALELAQLSRSLGLGLGLSGRLNVAFIERVNLTVRHGVVALARHTWPTAKPAPQLLIHLEWWRAS